MWKIRNNTGGILIIDDLGIDLKPRQEFDLDLLGRDKSEDSSNLAVLLDKNAIEILHKDVIAKRSDISNDDLGELITGAMLNFMGGAFNNVSSELSKEVAASVAQSIKDGLSNVNIINQVGALAEGEDEGEAFDDLNLKQVQTDLFHSNGKLDPGFNSIGEKVEVKDSNDIADQLRAIKRKDKAE